MKRVFALSIASCLFAVATQAAVFNIPSDPADTTIGLNEALEPVVSWTGQAEVYLGDEGYQYGKGENCGVLVFPLPDLGGEAISTANLTVDMYAGYPGGINDWPKSIDLYGVRYASAANVLATDYGAMASAPVGNGTLLQQGVWVLASSGVFDWTAYETSVSGDAALAAWLTAQYTAGAQAGDFVFLRFNIDKYVANPINIASGNATAHNVPMLTIETVPEPASVALLALGALAIARRR